jgi:serine/threonine protein kinase
MTASSGIALGPFALLAPIGVGGMGEVWAGVHAVAGDPVAIKVLTENYARDPIFVRSFRNEVRATAALDHPSIVAVLDFGEVSAAAEEASAGRLQAGSPYLVMERVDGGSLQDVLGVHPWDDLRRDLLVVLDALAHAHARGVIHRDLKPANVLRHRDGALRLTDFGIAHAIERLPGGQEIAEEITTGTPRYMAPEQFEAQWRDYGPWTDLYALGCTAYALTSGAPPFSGTIADLREKHVHGEVPPLKPRLPVAAGFEAWVHRLLEKDPRRRYARAADAAWGLFRLGEARESRPPLPPGAAPERETVAMTLTFVDPDPTTQDRRPSVPPPRNLSGPDRRDPAPRPITLPPLPVKWQRPHDRAARRAYVAGVGLGLFGLRAIPLVDRDRERSVLWKLLHDVRASHATQMVVLHGAAGQGKSRLAEWLVERSHELGAAHVLRATHAPIPGPLDGIAPMIARHLRAVGLPHRDALARIAAILRAQGCADPDEHAALAELVSPADGEDAAGPDASARVRFGSSAERYEVVRRHLGRLASDRGVVIWLDDVQWGLDALDFCRYLLDAQERTPTPALVVLTARDEMLAEQAEAAGTIAGLFTRPSVMSLEVGPLPAEHRRELVRGLLGLAGDLAARVEERTAGNALFAVQLVGDWVQRGLLEPSDEGFRLRTGATVDLPEDVHGFWAGRVARVLAGRVPEDRAALEIAAVLGQEVDSVEWTEACAEAGVRASLDLVEDLIARRLARPAVEGPLAGWSFVHAMLRESLERAAIAADRAAPAHLACARMLGSRSGRGGIAERIGRHLLAANDVEAALGPLLAGARERLLAGDYRIAEMLLRDREQAMIAVGFADREAAWGDGWVVAAKVAHQQGRLEDAERTLARVEDAGWRYGWARARVEARIERALVSRLRGDLAAAVRDAELAQQGARAEGDGLLVARALLAFADASRSQGSLDTAEDGYSRAEPLFAVAGDEDGRGWCHLGLALVERQRGVMDAAERHGALAREAFAACGSRRGMGLCANVLGEPARYRGDLDAAEARYREALQRFEAIGALEKVVAEVNLGLIALARRRFADARGHLERAAAECRRRDNKLYLAATMVFLLPCAAASGSWAEWDRLIADARVAIDESGLADVDLPDAARLAASIASEAGETARAADAEALAASQLRALGRDQKPQAPA